MCPLVYSLTNTAAPAGGRIDSGKGPGDGKAGEKAVKKKGRKKKQSAKGQPSDKPLRDEASSHQGVEPQLAQSQTTCDHSTQTEIESTQTQATQTLPLQCTYPQPTECKSSQTARSRPTYKQVYENQGSSGQQGEDQAASTDQSRDPNQLTVLTWNIDGLDVEDLKERVPSLLGYLGK